MNEHGHRLMAWSLLAVLAGALTVRAEAIALVLPDFEGSTIGTSRPAYPAQSWWVNPSDPDRNQHAAWSVAVGEGTGGSDAAVAVPGANAMGGSADYVQALRVYYIAVQPETEYTLDFWYKAIGAGFSGDNVGAGSTNALESELQLQVLEYANADMSGAPVVKGLGNIGAQTSDWTHASYTFTTDPGSHGIGFKFGMLFGAGNRTNPTDRLYLDNVAVPCAPAGLTAAAFGATAIDLVWSSGGGEVSGYWIEQAIGTGPFERIATVPGDATSYRALFLPASSLGSYRMTAFNDRRQSTAATASASTAAADPQALPGPALANVRDYGYMWWQNGMLDPVYHLKTSRYAMSFHAAALGPTALFPLLTPSSEAAALTESDATSIPPSPPVTFTCRVVAHESTNLVVAFSSDNHDAQLVECGKFFQRRWHKVSLPGGPGLDGQKSGLEVAAWPDRIAFVLRVVPTNAVVNGRIEMTLGVTNAYATLLASGVGRALQAADGAGFVFLKSAGSDSLTVDAAQGLVTVRTAAGDWIAGQEYSAGFIVYPAATNVAGVLDGAVAEESAPLTLTATEVVPTTTPLATAYDADRGWYEVTLRHDVGTGDDGMVRTRLAVTNGTASPRVLRLNFDGIPFYIPGLTAVLRDASRNPVGIPVQLSKNWHTSPAAERFQGWWFHGLTMLTVPAGAALNLELVMVGQNWGGLPAATHSQLSVIGYGGQQQWDEAALGNYGEALTYDAEHVLTDNDCADSRPMLVTDENGNHGAWGINVGGASFLRYSDAGGQPRRHSRMRTRYARYCPNLAEAVYAGKTDDDAMEFSFSAGLFRSDDYTRGLHRVRIDVTADTSFSRLVFFQEAADTYNGNNGATHACGNATNLAPLRQWAATFGQNQYIGTPMALSGPMPWAMTLDSPPEDGYTAANRGFVIRSWKARLNGTNDTPPYLAERSTADGSILDLVPPPGTTTLKAGDYVEAEIVRFYVPRFPAGYYGPNAHFRTALTNYENSYRIGLREAAGNTLSVSTQTGTVEQLFPVQIKVADNQAAFTVTGGLGHVPFTFTGLSDYRGPVLEENLNGVWTPLNQAVHGNDFWQCDYNAGTGAWEITFTANLDGPEYQTVESLMASPRTHTFRFRLDPEAIERQLSLPDFEEAVIGSADPGYSNRTWWVKPSDPDRDQYARWSLEPRAGVGGSAAAVASPGPNARGGSDAYMQALRLYYFAVLPNTEYTVGFWYKAIGPGFTGHTGRYERDGFTSDSELQLQILEAPQADCTGGWQWPQSFSIGTAAADWTYASFTFTTLTNTHGIGLKFSALFGDGNRTNAADRFYLDNATNFVAALAPRGTPQWWLTDHGLTNGGFATAELGDQDNDGLFNWQEYLARTNPTNAASVLKVLSLQEEETGVRVRWQGGADVREVLERADSVTAQGFVWQSLYTNGPPSGMSNEFLDVAESAGPHFYRIRANLP
jgi:hypothetical protein